MFNNDPIPKRLNELQSQFNDSGDHAGAVEQYESLLEETERTLGAEHEYLPAIMQRLAFHYKWMGQYDKCESLCERCLEINRKLHGERDRSVASSLISLGTVIEHFGEYPRAEALYQRSLAIYEKVSPNSMGVVAALGNLAGCASALGEHDKAERLLRRGLHIIEKKKDGPKSASAAMFSGNLASAYLELGRLKEAARYSQRQIAIWQSMMAPQRKSAIEVLSDNLLREMFGAVNNRPGTSALRPSLAIALFLDGHIKESQGDNAEAERVYQRGIKLAEEHFGAAHHTPAGGRLLLGTLYFRAERYEEAEPLLLSAVRAFDGRLNPVMASRALSRIAALHAATGTVNAAADEFDRERRIVRREAAIVLAALSADEQSRYLGDRDRAAFAGALSFAVANRHAPRITELSAGWLVNGKAAALQDAADRAKVGHDATDPRVAATIKRLKGLKAHLSALASVSPPPNEKTKHLRQLHALETQVEELERELCRARGQSSPESDWTEVAEIRQALAADAVLVDIAKFKYQLPPIRADEVGAEAYRYVAWVIPAAEKGEVQIVDLGEAKPIEGAVEACRVATSGPARATGTSAATREPLDAMSRLVLKPLLPYIAAAKEIVISPDAALWFVPWAALPIDGDANELTFLLEKWRIRYVTGGRDVVHRPTAGVDAKPNSPCIFANPNYDLDLADAEANIKRLLGLSEPEPVSKKVASRAKTPASKDAVTKRGAASIGPAGRLPGTAAEAKATVAYLKKYVQLDPVVYVDGDALEGLFKQLHSPRVLVLSTHGFFLPDGEPADDRAFQPLNLAGSSGGRATVNPLLRCGLLLAACNQRDQNKNKALDDGVLTGLEIASADLRHTQLVVLSACETGVGDVVDGNTVACIRRAFQSAGARAVVATLWRIPDQETTWLMTRFWANLASGQSKAEALRDAQLMVLRRHGELRALSAKRNQGQLDTIVGRRGLKLGDDEATPALPEKTPSSQNGISRGAHPFYWAAFTITGD